MIGCRDRESDVLDVLSDIYSDLSEASMNFQTHYGVTLPFNVPSLRTHSIHTLYSCVCVHILARAFVYTTSRAKTKK